MQLTEGSTLQSIFIEKDVVAYGHYVAGVFNGTLIINGTSMSSAAGGLFAVRLDSSNNVRLTATCDQIRQCECNDLFAAHRGSVSVGAHAVCSVLALLKNI